MTRDEFKILVKGMKAVYTAPSFIPDKDAFEVWYGLLRDIPYDVASSAIQSYMATEDEIPKPANIREKVKMISGQNELNELEAWALVSNALRNGYYGAEKEFAKLPPLVQKAVGTPGNLRNWSQTEMGSVENVIQSNFIRTYRSVLKRDDEINKLPSELLQMIENRTSTGIDQKS